MVKIYIMNVTPLLLKENEDRVIGLLPADRRGRLDKIRQPMERARCVAAGLLLVYAAGGRKKGELHVEKTPGGKPYLKDRPGFYFNLSHSGEYAVCAVSDSEVGVDIQEKKKVASGFADRILHEREKEQYVPLGEETGADVIAVWAAKEAYVKYTGEGLSHDFRGLYADPGARTVTDTKTGARARLYMPGAPEGYVLAVCTGAK